MLTQLNNWLKRQEAERRLSQQRRMERAYRKMGDRYQWRGDEARLSDDCVARVRANDGPLEDGR